MLLLMSLFQANAADMEIHIQDPSVTEVQLNCSGRVLKSPVSGAIARFPAGELGDCSVSLLSQVGAVSGNDKYTCTARGCTRNAVEHRQVSSAADRVTIILTDESTKLMELRCPSGYRQRAPVTTNTAVFDGVPAGQQCALYWKNSAPGLARNITVGTWYCLNTDGTGVCRRP